jgi:glycosyltransferase involved in cell wall biosynthesis
MSIVMASYQRLSLLKSAVGSALAQDYPHYEVLVVDDGSDEDTRAWLRAAEQRDIRLRIVFQEHQGIAAARARGVAEARGDLVCILDSDDMLVPTALRRMREEVERHPQAVLFHTGIKELRPGGAARVVAYPVFESARSMLWATLLRPRVPFKHSGTLFRRSTAIELGSYNRDLPCKVDIDLYLKFLRAGHRPQLIAEPLVEFRMHKNSVSRDRLLGVRVWFRLIECYGPRNPVLRFGLKLLRAVSEMLKALYLETRG